MRCDEVERAMALLVAGEAGDSEMHAARQHAAHCASCAAQLSEQQELLRLLESRPRRAIDQATLVAYRARLDDALDDEAAALPHRWMELWRRLPASLGRARQFAFAPGLVFALVLVGFISGWVSHGRIASPAPPAEEVGTAPAPGALTSLPIAPASNRVYRVSSIQPSSDGGVSVIYDDLQRRSVKGSAQDPQIQRLLLYALQNPPNSGVRLDSIDALRAQGSDDDVRQTMLWVLAHDPNAGVRLKALEWLRSSVRDHELVRDSLVRAVLSDNNLGVRGEAIDALAQAPPQDASRILQQVARQTANPYVRLRCAAALRQMQAPIPPGIVPAIAPGDEK